MGTPLTLPLLQKILGKMNAAQRTNADALIQSLSAYGDKFGINQPHRLAQFVGQVIHESDRLKTAKEYWGPTAQQKKYDPPSTVAKRLGNTQKGDGAKFRGYGLIQNTGRYNTGEFLTWCRKMGFNPPDFIATPSLMATAPWSGLTAIWYWTTRNLNRLADRGDIENITKSINGGLNGYEDRVLWYTRTGLVLLGFGTGKDDIEAFQKFAGVKPVDGVAGPVTRAAIHEHLLKDTPKAKLSAEVQVAPVVEEKKVVPKSVDNAVKNQTRFGLISTAATGFGGMGLAGLFSSEWTTVLAIGAIVVVLLIVLLVMQNQLASALDKVRKSDD